MTDDEIRRRLTDFEDGWIERKSQGVNNHDIRKTLVAFANALSQGEQAILFIGISDDGTILGVDDPSKIQGRVNENAQKCYPRVTYTIRALTEQGKRIIAVIIEPSPNKPHFTGAAFMRVGNQSVEATESHLDEMIAARSSRAWPLVQAKQKGEKVTIITCPFGLQDYTVRSVPIPNYEIVSVTSQIARFRSATGDEQTADLNHVRFSHSADGQLMIEIE
jgi:predicted HTH transcriptional regulator